MVKKIPLTNAKIEALSMYLQGIKEIEIAKQLGKNRHTISNWKQKYNWDEHFRKLEEETRAKNIETNEDRKDRILKIYRAIQVTFVKSLQEGKAEINALDAVRAMQAETRLMGLDIQKIEIPGEDGPVDWIRVLKEAEEEDALKKERVINSKER